MGRALQKIIDSPVKIHDHAGWMLCEGAISMAERTQKRKEGETFG
jgi:hypothetical protein